MSTRVGGADCTVFTNDGDFSAAPEIYAHCRASFLHFLSKPSARNREFERRLAKSVFSWHL
jgi:hypothetical protein